MVEIINLISQFQGYILVGAVVLIIILFISNFVVFKSLSALERKYKKFMGSTNGNNIEEMILEYMDKVDECKAISEEVASKYNDMDVRLKGCVQKVSLLRFKAFEDVGSDLSFSVALLDDGNDGVILTGIYSRNDSTTYAKPVDKGISRYELSEEEKYVLNDAMNKKED